MTHDDLVLAAADAWADARGGPRVGETTADLTLYEAVLMRRHAQRVARSEEDTRPVKVKP